MNCRPHCAACCIAPSISTPLPGLPSGKPAGFACVHLDAEKRCLLFGDPRRPAVCGSLRPQPSMCGSTAEEAMRILTLMEVQTRPS